MAMAQKQPTTMMYAKPKTKNQQNNQLKNYAHE